jgi:hypothetical protein
MTAPDRRSRLHRVVPLSRLRRILLLVLVKAVIQESAAVCGIWHLSFLVP